MLNSKCRAERQRKSFSTFKAAQVSDCLVSVKWWCSYSFKWWIWIRPSWPSFRLPRRGTLYWRYSLINFDVFRHFYNVRKKTALCGDHFCAVIYNIMFMFMFMKCIAYGNSCFFLPPIYMKHLWHYWESQSFIVLGVQILYSLFSEFLNIIMCHEVFSFSQTCQDGINVWHL